MESLGTGAAIPHLIGHVLPQFLHHRLFSVDQYFCHSLSNAGVLAPVVSRIFSRENVNYFPQDLTSLKAILCLGPIRLLSVGEYNK